MKEGGRMEIIFYNMKEYASQLRMTMEPYISEHFIEAHYSSSQNLSQGEKSLKNHLIFYQMQDAPNIIGLDKKQYSFRKVALCKNNEQGIEAIGNGSDYALLLPLNKNKILSCCHFILKDWIQK